MLGAADTEQVRRMIRSLQHRGPDGTGYCEGKDYALGHARLSIIDIEGGAQPMADREDQARIVFNGEIYNYRALRRAMGEERFRTCSDTEAILALSARGEAPEQWVRNLDGMFAFALVRGNDVILARDPLGIKPLYLGHRKDAVLVASEIKALAGSSDVIVEFPPGHVFSSSAGMKRYYSVPTPRAGEEDLAEAEARLLARLDAAVEKRLIADVPVGVFLSGGLDSSLISFLARRHQDVLHSFSVCTEDSPDRSRARQVAEFLGTLHHERVFTAAEALKALPEVIYYLESFDCALVRSAMPNFFLARLAADHVKVALSGEGADELFAGYDYLKGLAMDGLPDELHRITSALHNTNLQRCDRMSMAHGLEVRVPFMDVAVVELAFSLPVEFKQHGPDRTDKWILRKVASLLLPADIAWRPKIKFAAGSGLGASLARHAEERISDAEFERFRRTEPEAQLRSKEELFYYRIFRDIFPRKDLLPLVGRSRSV